MDTTKTVSTSPATLAYDAAQKMRKFVCAQYGIKSGKTGISSLGLIAIRDEKVRIFLAEGISAIGGGAIVLGDDTEMNLPNIATKKSIPESETAAFDFFVTDNESDTIDVVRCMRAGIVPVMPARNTYADILRDFDPLKFEGNGFFYTKNDPYSIFARIVAYFENVKFPEDRRVLIKNVKGAF